MLEKSALIDLYLKKGKSLQDIASCLKCSVHTVRYWMNKHIIGTRSISDAVYLKNNPDGNPFIFKEPKTIEDALLYGLGIGLYWGEGTKANKHSVRLGNSDPKLIKKFIEFLIRIFGVKKKDMRFWLHIFTDIDVSEAVDFWIKELQITAEQFYKPMVTLSGSLGTYRKKSKYGVLTVIYNNKKLRDILVSKLPM